MSSVRSLINLLCAAALLMAGIGLCGCASQLTQKFSTIDKRDQLRFAACRKDVARRVCPDDPDCEVRAAEMYAAENPDARLRWLLDYKCPRNKIEIADKAWNDKEKQRLGTR